jgi:Membrane-associated phospholipid phosphatase
MPAGTPRRALAATVVTAVVLVVLLGVVIRYGLVRSFDAWISAGATRYGRDHAGWTTAAWWVTQLGGHLAALAILVPLLVWLGVARRWLAAGYAAVAVLTTGPLVELVKHLVRRPRPDPTAPFAHFAGLSFPSGHSAHAAAEVLVLWILLLPLLAARGRRAVASAITVGVVVVLAVGWSRIALGAHYPTDVLAGSALGAAWAAGTAWLGVGLSMRGQSRQNRSQGQSADR